jgi:Glutamine synthetase
VVLRHRADAMRAADEAIQWKRLVRGVAAKHGLLATFMAKPYSGRAGSGFHIHASLADAKGTNLFAAEDPQGTPLMRQAIAGLLATIADGMGVLPPMPIPIAVSNRRATPRSPGPGGSTTAASPCGCRPADPRRAISSIASPAPMPIPISPSHRAGRDA